MLNALHKTGEKRKMWNKPGRCKQNHYYTEYALMIEFICITVEMKICIGLLLLIMKRGRR